MFFDGASASGSLWVGSVWPIALARPFVGVTFGVSLTNWPSADNVKKINVHSEFRRFPADQQGRYIGNACADAGAQFASMGHGLDSVQEFADACEALGACMKDESRRTRIPVFEPVAELVG